MNATTDQPTSSGPDSIDKRVLLDDLAVVKVSGPDRADFLQGQLTQDISSLGRAHTKLTGWATAKGRLLMVAQLIDWNDAFWLVLPGEIAGAAIARLRLFVLRAQVTVQSGDVDVIGEFDGGETTGQVGHAISCKLAVCGDPGRRLTITEKGTTPAPAADASALQRWRLADIRAGLPAVLAATSEAFVPQMLNLDCLDAISFTKGCYVGQEIVARTQNLGRIKRRMFRYRCDAAGKISPGAGITSADGTAGRVVNAVEHEGTTELLAVIALSEHDKPLFADEQQAMALEERPLPYALPE